MDYLPADKNAEAEDPDLVQVDSENAVEDPVIEILTGDESSADGPLVQDDEIPDGQHVLEAHEPEDDDVELEPSNRGKIPCDPFKRPLVHVIIFPGVERENETLKVTISPNSSSTNETDNDKAVDAITEMESKPKKVGKKLAKQSHKLAG